MACSCNVKSIGQRKSKMATKTKRRRRSIRGLNSSGIQSTVTAAALGGVGAVVFGIALEKILPAEYIKYSHYAKIVGGALMASMSKNKMVQAAGLGAATVGAASVVSDLTDGVNGVSGLGLIRPGGQYQYRIAGNGQDNVIMQ